MNNEKNTLIVISDLHLSAGLNEETKCFSREEDFFFDNEFKRFLEYLEKENPGKNHLIINGDLFDFLQVNGDFAKRLEKEGKIKLDKKEDIYGLGTEPHKTVFKLQRIQDGHQIFFEALNAFLSKGNNLSIISGNHDIELYWDDVQKELINILSNNDNDIKNRIKFYLWFYYDKENKIYIEHGNQYDDWNSFKHILYPIMPPAAGKKILLPFGSFFVRYFFNKVEDFNPFADNIKPSSKYMQMAFRKHPVKALKLLRRYIPAMFKAFWRSGGVTKAQEVELRKEEEKMLADLSKEAGLPLDNVLKLHEKAILPITRGKLVFLINLGWIGTIFLLVIITTAAFFIKQAFNLSIWSLLSGLLAFLPLLISWLMSKLRKDTFTSILIEIRAKILTDLKIIVMGHTHDPDIKKIAHDCWYYNTSTWTTVFSEEERLIREEKQFALLEIKLTDKGPYAQLMRWHDSVGKCEPLILFEKQKDG